MIVLYLLIVSAIFMAFGISVSFLIFSIEWLTLCIMSLVRGGLILLPILSADEVGGFNISLVLKLSLFGFSCSFIGFNLLFLIELIDIKLFRDLFLLLGLIELLLFSLHKYYTRPDLESVSFKGNRMHLIIGTALNM